MFFLAWALTQKTGARGNNGAGSVSTGYTYDLGRSLWRARILTCACAAPRCRGQGRERLASLTTAYHAVCHPLCMCLM